MIKKSASDALVVIDPLGSTEGWMQEVHGASLGDRTGSKVVFKVFSCTHLDQAGRLTGQASGNKDIDKLTKKGMSRINTGTKDHCESLLASTLKLDFQIIPKDLTKRQTQSIRWPWR